MKNLFLTFVALTCTVCIHAQNASRYNFTMNHLALSVKNVDVAADFYKNVLGLEEITNKTKIDGIRWFSLGEGKELHLISTVKGKVTINKAIHLALTSPDFDAFIQNLIKMNIAYSDWPGVSGKINIRADGIQQVFFQDVDGYWIEVNSVGQK